MLTRTLQMNFDQFEFWKIFQKTRMPIFKLDTKIFHQTGTPSRTAIFRKNCSMCYRIWRSSFQLCCPSKIKAYRNSREHRFEQNLNGEKAYRAFPIAIIYFLWWFKIVMTFKLRVSMNFWMSKESDGSKPFPIFFVCIFSKILSAIAMQFSLFPLQTFFTVFAWPADILPFSIWFSKKINHKSTNLKFGILKTDLSNLINHSNSIR